MHSISKKKFNLWGGGFQHSSSSTLYKIPNNIIWDYNSFLNEETFYVDDSIIKVFDDNFSKIKYGWLLESKYITPNIEEYCHKTYPELKKYFKYIFTHNKNLIKIDKNFFKFAPANGTWISNPYISNKNKLISMITSNKSETEGHKKRLEIAKMFYNNLDLYGRGFNEIQKKEEGLEEYMFSICIENGMYETYFTEKILDCFAVGTIPIYLGTPDIFDYFNKDGIILLDQNFSINKLSIELYESKKNAIIDNFERVKKYNTSEDWIYENYFKELKT